MKELKNIKSLIDEISYLKNRSLLLDEILKYWDKETMSFDVPKEWKGKGAEELLLKIPKSPRHSLNNKIHKLLPYEDAEYIVNWDELDE